MFATRYAGSHAPHREERQQVNQRTTRFVIISLLPVSLLFWIIGVATTNATTLGLYGLPANLSPVFYAGLILLIISAGIELARKEVSHFRLGSHAGALVLMLYGTAALVYSQGRYAWLYKTVGVVQYVKVNGHLTTSIDIYQNWPGFFALAAWFDRIAGVSTPLDYAKWAQLVFELAALPLLYSIYSSLSLPIRHRWLGIMLYSGSNWIAQDYFSPQALSTVLSLGIMAIALRWMLAGNTLSHMSRDEEDPPASPERPREGTAALRQRDTWPFIAAFLLLFFVLAFSHELSPYIIVVQLVALAFVGQLRPRWIPLAGAAITIGYLLPHFAYVNTHYGLLASFGNFFSNVQSPSAYGTGTPPESQHIIGDCADLLSVGIWLLALVGAWLRRKSRRTVIALLFLTFSPVFVLIGGAYGGEGILRVYLFSLPWAVALAASALAPVRPLSDGKGRELPSAADVTGGTGRRNILSRFDRGTLRAPIALGLAVVLFLPAFFGNDSSNVMPATQVAATTSFLESAQPGVVLAPLDDTSLSDTAKYNQFPLGVIFGQYSIMGNTPATADIAGYLARTVENYTNATAPGYVIVTPSMMAYNAAYGAIQPAEITTLLSSLRTSPYWERIVSDDGTVIYATTAAAHDIPPGPYNSNPIFAVP